METTKKLDSYLNEFAHKEDSEEKAEPKVRMVKVRRFNKVFNRREEMEVPEDEVELAGYYADILVE